MQAKSDLELAHRDNNLAKMSELQYGKIPELETKIAEAEAADTVSSVLPTPVGPININEPSGRLGSDKPARERRTASDITVCLVTANMLLTRLQRHTHCWVTECVL
jgi:hypothetical protein